VLATELRRERAMAAAAGAPARTGKGSPGTGRQSPGGAHARPRGKAARPTGKRQR
jgi:preprotein translocase subunit SecF